MTTDKHHQIAQGLHACHNGLGLDHLTKNCPSNRLGRECGRRHHTPLLKGDTNHESTPTSNPDVQPSFKTNTMKSETVCTTTGRSKTSLLLTCRVYIAVGGHNHTARAFIDPGSTLSFIYNRLMASLKVKKVPTVTLVTGIGQISSPTSKYQPYLNLICSVYPDKPPLTMDAAVVDAITGIWPTGCCQISER